MKIDLKNVLIAAIIALFFLYLGGERLEFVLRDHGYTRAAAGMEAVNGWLNRQNDDAREKIGEGVEKKRQDVENNVRNLLPP